MLSMQEQDEQRQSYQKTELVKKLIYIITSAQMAIESLEFIL